MRTIPYFAMVLKPTGQVNDYCAQCPTISSFFSSPSSSFYRTRSASQVLNSTASSYLPVHQSHLVFELELASNKHLFAISMLLPSSPRTFLSCPVALVVFRLQLDS